MQNDSQLPVTMWLRDFENGDDEAAQNLWDFYYHQIKATADRRADNLPPGIIDGEDIAASVFESLWRGANNGRFREVASRDELWYLLLALTKQKIANHVRKQTARKRGNGAVPASIENQEALQISSSEAPADAVAILREEYSNAMQLLRDDQLRRIAELKLAGNTNDEIGEAVQVSSATVTRKLKLIRQTWQMSIGNQGTTD